jgi:rare lipoprotein A
MSETTPVSSFRFIYKANLASVYLLAPARRAPFAGRSPVSARWDGRIGKGTARGGNRGRAHSPPQRKRGLGLGNKRLWTTRLCTLVALCTLAGCAGAERIGIVDPLYGLSSNARAVAPGEPIPKGGGFYRIGAPYSIGGQIYVPTEDPHYRAEGLASWYGEDFHGRQTANGEIFDMNSVSAAHATLPLPSYLRVTNLSNNRSVIVRVNDRGPYHSDRIVDVSVKTAILLGFYTSGVAPVRVEYVGTAPLAGSDDGMLIATLRQGEPAPAPSLVRVASTRNLPGKVPLPSQRPYSLGGGQAPPNDTTGVLRTSAVEYNRSLNAAPIRPAVSAYAPASTDKQSSNFAVPALMPAANARNLY